MRFDHEWEDLIEEILTIFSDREITEENTRGLEEFVIKCVVAIRRKHVPDRDVDDDEE